MEEHNQERSRDYIHWWCLSEPIRILRKTLPKTDYLYARSVYTALCEIDNDFRDQIDHVKTKLKNLRNTCATYAGMHPNTTSKYMQLLREMNLINYGPRRNSKGLIIGTYLIIKDGLNVQATTERRMDKKPNKIIHATTERRDVPAYDNKKNTLHKPDSVYFPSENKKKVFSKPSLRIKLIFSDNGNKDSSVDEQSPLQLLGDWLDYDIPVLPYNKPVINLRTKLFEKKIKPSARLVKSILDYWNGMATALKLNGWKVPLHYIKNNKTTFLCQLIVTGLSKINNYTEREIKNAIDNHAIIMDNSNWYRKSNGQKPYNFIQFFSNQKLFEDCITDNIKGNSRYFNVKGGNGTSLATILEKKLKQYSKINYGREPEGEELKYIKQEAWNEHDKILANRGIPKDKRKELLMKEWKEINHAR